MNRVIKLGTATRGQAWCPASWCGRRHIASPTVCSCQKCSPWTSTQGNRQIQNTGCSSQLLQGLERRGSNGTAQNGGSLIRHKSQNNISTLTGFWIEKKKSSKKGHDEAIEKIWIWTAVDVVIELLMVFLGVALVCSWVAESLALENWT